MRLGVDEYPSTSSTYAPFQVKEPKPHHFGYDKNYVNAPWARKRYSLSIEGLHEEILDVYNWLRPSSLETSVRYSVYEKVAKVIKERWSKYNVRVSVFGSLRTHLFLPTSDIDVLVECPEFSSEEQDVLQETAKALTTSGLAESINVLSGAFVPIVKMMDRDTQVSIDISFNTIQGVKAAEFIDHIKQEYPVIEPLVLILKQFLHQRNLNQTFTGGLSSYGLILILLNFLQIYASTTKGRNIFHPNVNLGELLMRFFEVYSQEFNHRDVRISCLSKKYIPRKKGDDQVLSVEDPLHSTNEVCRSTFNFPKIQIAFAQALQILKGVFVRDRRRSSLFCNHVYGGTMLALILPFTPAEINYRNWLKVGSFSMNYKAEPGRNMSNIVTNTFLAKVINLDEEDWSDASKLKPSKKLLITDPREEGQKIDNEPPSAPSSPETPPTSSPDIPEDTKKSDEEDVNLQHVVPKSKTSSTSSDSGLSEEISPKLSDVVKSNGTQAWGPNENHRILNGLRKRETERQSNKAPVVKDLSTAAHKDHQMPVNHKNNTVEQAVVQPYRNGSVVYNSSRPRQNDSLRIRTPSPSENSIPSSDETPCVTATVAINGHVNDFGKKSMRINTAEPIRNCDQHQQNNNDWTQQRSQRGHNKQRKNHPMNHGGGGGGHYNNGNAKKKNESWHKNSSSIRSQPKSRSSDGDSEKDSVKSVDI